MEYNIFYMRLFLIRYYLYRRFSKLQCIILFFTFNMVNEFETSATIIYRVIFIKYLLPQTLVEKEESLDNRG